MKRIVVILVMALAAVTAVRAQAAATLKIGVFDANRVSEETDEGKRIASKLSKFGDQKKAELAAKEKEVADLRAQLDSQSLSLSPEKSQQLQKEAQKKGLELQQAQEAARMGAYIEFVYGGTLEPGSKLTVAKYAEWIRAVGPAHCIISSDLGGARPYPRPMPTAGMLEFMSALHKEGISVADINLMAKTNPSRILGLEP